MLPAAGWPVILFYFSRDLSVGWLVGQGILFFRACPAVSVWSGRELYRWLVGPAGGAWWLPPATVKNTFTGDTLKHADRIF